MTSKIINMAEKFKDAEDRLLDTLFASESIDDDGFSDRIVSRIRRQMWIRRLTLPVAILVGGAIALKPATQVLNVGAKLLEAMPQEILAMPEVTLPQLPIILLGVTLLAIGALTARMLEE